MVYAMARLLSPHNLRLLYTIWRASPDRSFSTIQDPQCLATPGYHKNQLPQQRRPKFPVPPFHYYSNLCKRPTILSPIRAQELSIQLDSFVFEIRFRKRTQVSVSLD